MPFDFIPEQKNGKAIVSMDDASDYLIETVLRTCPGGLREFPLVGVCLTRRINSQSTETELKNRIREAMAEDGLMNITINIDGRNVNVSGQYPT